MAMQVKVGSFAKRTTLGSQSITGVGFTPKAIIFFGRRDTSGVDGFQTDQTMQFVGFTTGPTQSHSVSTSSETGQATSDTARTSAAAAIAMAYSTASIGAQADLTSFDVDGFTLNWTTMVFGSASKIGYIALGGTDLTNAKLVQWDMSTASADQTITAVGFKPDCVINAGTRVQGGGTYAGAFFSLGAMDKDGNQWATSFYSQDAVSPTNSSRAFFTDKALYYVTASETVENAFAFKSMNNDGFTVTWTNTATAVGQIMSLCLKGPGIKVGNFSGATAVGKQRIDGFGFSPVGVLTSTVGNVRNAATAQSLFSMGAASSASDEIGFAFRDEDNVATSDVQSYQHGSKMLSIPNDVTPTTLTHQADLDSLDDDGLTLNWTTNNSVSLPFGFIAFGDTPASATKGLKVKVGSFSALTTTGLQTIAHGLGAVPKAIIFYGTHRTANGFGNNAHLSVGFVTKSGASFEQFAVATGSDYAVATSNTARRMASQAISYVSSDATVLGEANMDSWDATNFVLNWTDTLSLGYIINFIALGGDDLTNAKVVSWEGATVTGNQSVTTVGFKPDCVIHAIGGLNIDALPQMNVWARLGIGVMDKHGNQWTNAFTSQDAVNPSNTDRYQKSDRCLSFTNGDGTLEGDASFVSMNSNGFTVNITDSFVTDRGIISLCLKGGSFKAGVFTKATGAAPVYQSVGGAGFQPKGMLFSGMRETALAAVPQAVWSLGAASNAVSAKAIAMQDRDAVTPTQVQAYQADKAITHPSESPGTILAEAGLASFDNNGFTLNWTTNDANAYQTFYLAFGDAVVEDTTLDAGTKVKVGSFGKSTVTGLQQITGIGFRPKALILYTSATTGSGFRTGVYFALGFSAGGGLSYSVSAGSDNAVTPSNTSRRMAKRALSLVSPPETTVFEMDLESFDGDGFTVNNISGGTAYIINYIAIGGIDTEEANVVKWDIAASSASKAVTGVGFSPDIAIHAGAGHTFGTTIPASLSYLIFALGAMDKLGNQWANNFLSADGNNPTKTARVQRTDSCLVETSENAVIQRRATFASMDADGFTINLPTNGAWTDSYFSLCIKGPSFKVGSFTKDTGAAPDAQSVIGVGFQPKGLLLSTFRDTASGTPFTHALWSLGAASSVGSEKAVSISDRDAVSPTVAQGYQNDYSLAIAGITAGDLEAAADLTSFDADGFSLSWVTNNAIASEILYIAIGDGNQAPNAPTLDSPAEGAVLYSTQSNTFQFDATDPDAGDTMSAWALKVTIQGTTRWWNATTNSWSATEHFNTEGSPPSFPVTDKQVVVGANEFDDFFA